MQVESMNDQLIMACTTEYDRRVALSVNRVNINLVN